MEFIHTKLVEHPLKNAWMVVNVSCPFVPPFIGTKRECEKARVAAEKSAENYLRKVSNL